MSNINSISGIYKCKTRDCNNEIVHLKGENFNKCGSCESNDWDFVRKTKLGVLIELSKTQQYLEWTKNMLMLDTKANSASKRIIKRGEVYKCKLGVSIGSEEGKERPCVIIQANAGNTKSSNTIIAPITHTTSTLPIVVPIADKFDNEQKVILDGNVLLGNIVTVSKARLGDYICKLSVDEMKDIDKAISISLDIKRHYDKLENIYKDKLDYIKKLKEKNSNYEEVISKIKKLCNENNSEKILKEIKSLLNKNVDK